jgi:hypothetical protein
MYRPTTILIWLKDSPIFFYLTTTYELFICTITNLHLNYHFDLHFTIHFERIITVVIRNTVICYLVLFSEGDFEFWSKKC